MFKTLTILKQSPVCVSGPLMHFSNLVLVAAISAFWLTGGIAQEAPNEALRELLCEQCPFDAPIRMRPYGVPGSGSRTVVTPEDMRALGVVSVSDMIEQQPDKAVDSPFDLGASIRELREIDAPAGERRQRLSSSQERVEPAADETDSTSAEVGGAASALGQSESNTATESDQEQGPIE